MTGPHDERTSPRAHDDGQQLTDGNGVLIVDDHAHNHGNTPAAWTAVAIILIAVAVGSYAVLVGNWPVFWIGVGLVVVGAIVGKVMSMMGYGGQTVRSQPEGQERQLDARE
ncbi:MAG TPA: HGxxPAAW family protein [Jiangellaceae bacterium]|nr:HGxxPAAW family protein [Jiangellaceae bacterium]